MFRGSSYHTIDAKGRVNIPARFRELIRNNGGNGLVLSGPGLDEKGLVAYPYQSWETVEEKILQMAEKSSAMRRFRRIFIGESAECPMDRQGRILIPQSLRDYASLEKDIVLVGVLDHFEIWSLENWNDEKRKLHEEDMKNEEVSNEIARLGL
ncbi:MraZ protein [Desulfosalsimonas propionicica]|uniref:Transcriptional regulator MraZ n=1 Tax=Desulfosalsimonas propionicica TaxID=332175 RepID=A0A7W0C8L1_9BACT|nr:division/cell wall cluster transcriptional repressor MraZ [Desulfosalsimonas propionicica]MBA2881127.1 MraZ protein [Desulfosalsimonas propionicica]